MATDPVDLRLNFDFSAATEAVERVAEAIRQWAIALGPVVEVIRKFVDSWNRVPYRDKLDLWLDEQPRHVQAWWKVYIWVLDKLDYHWDSGPEPWLE